MDIKSMSYIVASGIFTIGTEVNKRIKHKEIPTPIGIANLITILKPKVGEIDTINFQLCKTQSLSEPRMVINYKVDPETFLDTKTIINISDLNDVETIKYNNLIRDINFLYRK